MRDESAEAMEVVVGRRRVVEPARSVRAMLVAQMFGVGLENGEREVIVPRVSVPLPAGDVVFVTGVSGGGKTSLLHLIGRRLRQRDRPRVLWLEARDGAVDRPVIDAFDGDVTVDQALRWLSLAGLSEAPLLLRRGTELSEGQQHRLALARAMQRAEQALTEAPGQAASFEAPSLVLLADEFGIRLDRHSARVIARRLRQWARGSGICAVVASSHDDVLEALEPAVLIEKGPGEELTVVHRPTMASDETR